MIESFRARRTLAAVAIVAAAGAGLAACGGGNGYGSARPAPTRMAGADATGGVTLTSTSDGKVLADGSGHTLYLLTSDTQGRSTCTGTCVASWPVVAPSTAHAAGVTATLGSLTRSDGTKQLTVDGMPAYTYAADTAAGDVNGQGITSFGGTWWVLAADGSPVMSASMMPSMPMNRY